MKYLLLAGATVLALSIGARAGLFGPSDSYKYDPPPAWVGRDIAAIKRINDDCAARHRAGKVDYNSCGAEEVYRLDKQLRDADWCDGDTGMVFAGVGGFVPSPVVTPIHCSDRDAGFHRIEGYYPHYRDVPIIPYEINADTGQLVPRCDEYLGRRIDRITPLDQKPDPELKAALDANRCE